MPILDIWIRAGITIGSNAMDWLVNYTLGVLRLIVKVSIFFFRVDSEGWFSKTVVDETYEKLFFSL